MMWEMVFTSMPEVLLWTDCENEYDLGELSQDEIERRFDADPEADVVVVGAVYTAWLIWQAQDIGWPSRDEPANTTDIGRFCEFLKGWEFDRDDVLGLWDVLVEELIEMMADDVEMKVTQRTNDVVRDVMLAHYSKKSLRDKKELFRPVNPWGQK